MAAIVVGLSVMSGPGRAEAPSEPASKQEAMAAFYRAVLIDCLGSRTGGVAVADLSDKAREGFHIATPAERKATPVRDPRVPVWVSDRLGTNLVISEPKLEECQVVAAQLPVARTLDAVVGFAERREWGFQPVEAKAGYYPIVHRLERQVEATHYVLRLEGAEPGAPGHIFRFSLIVATVQREGPPTAKGGW